jgi:hypothetical protein
LGEALASILREQAGLAVELGNLKAESGTGN